MFTTNFMDLKGQGQKANALFRSCHGVNPFYLALPGFLALACECRARGFQISLHLIGQPLWSDSKPQACFKTKIVQLFFKIYFSTAHLHLALWMMVGHTSAQSRPSICAGAQRVREDVVKRAGSRNGGQIYPGQGLVIFCVSLFSSWSMIGIHFW